MKKIEFDVARLKYSAVNRGCILNFQGNDEVSGNN